LNLVKNGSISENKNNTGFELVTKTENGNNRKI
jgi:hypothetical protein